MNQKKNEERTLIRRMATIILIVALLLVFLFAIFYRREIRISEGDLRGSVDFLSCQAKTALEPFFDSNTAMEQTHDVKIIFGEESFDKINYTFTGKFSSNENATTAMADMHAKYNIYMNEINVYQENLQPTFSVIGSDGIINFSIDKSNFTSGTAKLVFLDEEEFMMADQYEVDDFVRILNREGFSCKYRD